MVPVGLAFALLSPACYASAFGAWALFGNKPVENAGAIQSKIARRYLLRDNLLYFAVAMVAVTITIAVLINDTEKGIHRSFKNDWFVGFGSACVALGYAAKAFWISRRDWRLWTIIAALFALFTAITIPVLAQMEKVPLLFAFAVLDWFIGKQSRRFTS